MFSPNRKYSLCFLPRAIDLLFLSQKHTPTLQLHYSSTKNLSSGSCHSCSNRMASSLSKSGQSGSLSDRERTPSSRISTILFDLDNTIIPTKKADDITIKKVSQKLTREYEIPVQVANDVSEAYLRRFRRCVENPRMSIDDWRILLWAKALGEEYEEFAEEIYGKWKKLRYRNMIMSEETVSLLRTLRKQYQLGLVTNGPSNSQWEKIKELELEQYFDCIAVSGDFTYEKPDPKIFQTICASLGVQPFECLIVGDKLDTDIAGGCAADLGITVWIPLDDVEAEVLSHPNPQPDFIIKDISELLRLLGRPKKNERARGKGPVKPKVRTSSSGSNSGSGTGTNTSPPQVQLPSTSSTSQSTTTVSASSTCTKLPATEQGDS